MTELSPRYDPAEVEAKWYRYWKEAGFFRADPKAPGPVFAIVLPPPNVTGILHLGHALNNTWQDVLIRFHRMRGENTLWLPGIDHAGIHTQMKVEERLREQGIDRRAIGREAFLAEVWRWKAEYGDEILRQIERLGASVDWSRLRFTLDPGLSRAVTEVFVRLYREGLVYRGHYITNWCVSCRTALSDIEVEHVEEAGTLTTIRYPLADGSGAIEVATTRPETMLGDTAVAVHPDDPRWRDWVGREVVLPLVGRRIPIVADPLVDPEFGTGAVKVTPAHDPTDFAIGQRHGLSAIHVIGEDGRMTAEAGPYAGLDRYAARERVRQDLRAGGYLVREEAITHAVGHCEKCGAVIEPLRSLQWFVRVAPLAEAALEAVRRGAVEFVPERFAKVYLNWMENIHDWCISRQIWWGHRIPAYYCQQCGATEVAADPPTCCPHCGGPMEQDADVLDTWFSSALWPFSTLGWPEDTEDLRVYYPTAVLSTGYDIIFFWVARMIMQGVHFTGQVPFRTVLLHGLVRDAQGRKMSKSLGNGVNPSEVIDRYGADALRIALVLGSTPGNDIRYSEEKVKAGGHFANKIYNAVRFVRLNLTTEPAVSDRPRHPVDRWILSRLDAVVARVTDLLLGFEFGEAARAVYDFWWDEFCDWYIELAKVRLREEAWRSEVLGVLVTVAETALRLLHPFMPFVTEELWQSLPHRGPSIMVAPWPVAAGRADPEAEARVGVVQAAVRTGRNLRAELGLSPQARLPRVVLVSEAATVREAFEALSPEMAELLRVERVEVTARGRVAQAIAGVTEGGTVYLPLAGVVDPERERERLLKAQRESQAEWARTVARLGDAGFRNRAPAEVVAKTAARVEELEARLKRIAQRLEDLQ
ncbi:MAG: valine--tRNA ligase [Firmicutes bacterium]|nr:valine--tRNA ligase [Alicyclobacillaceae bacterium]MCL6496990.1 valine--tRNA ligase [Bacillota bacterium]